MDVCGYKYGRKGTGMQWSWLDRVRGARESEGGAAVKPGRQKYRRVLN